MEPHPTEMIHEEALTFILALRMRDARIAPRATAVLAEEPIQVRRAILRIAAKIVDVGAAEVAEEQCAAFPVVAAIVIASVLCHSIEGIELCAHRWNDAADSIRLAGCLRGCDLGLELNDWKGLVIVAGVVRRTEGADAASFDRMDCNRSGAVAPAVWPVEQIGGAVKIDVPSRGEVQAASDRGSWETRRVIGIVVTMGARSEVSEFHGEIDIGLQRSPGSKVAKFRSVELRMEAEVGSDAGVRVCGLVAVVRAGYHEPGLTGGQILDHREYSSKVIARHILDGDAQPVALIHQ